MGKFTLDKSSLKKSLDKVDNNGLIADFYDWLGSVTDDPVLETKAKRMRLCLRYIDSDFYRFQNVKNITRVNKCRDIFCQNCQSQLAKERFFRYVPFLDSLRSDYDLYHITFTVGNVYGEELKSAVKKMYEKFVYIVQYFDGRRKSRFMDFSQFGFAGCVRSFEITIKMHNGKPWYHPHFHCLFVLKKDLDLKKVFYNCFSHSYKSERLRSYSRLEILLQNFWYLTYNGLPFTEKNFDEISRGYSCTADKCRESDYHEVFKYAVGNMFRKVNSSLLTREVLNDIYVTLYRRKIIQGYGILKKFTFESEDDIKYMEEYYEEIRRLRDLEKPVAVSQTIYEVLDDMDRNVRFISKNNKVYKEEGGE